MKIAFLVLNVNGMGGTERSVITQANALADRHDVRLISVVRREPRPTYDIDPRVKVDYLADTAPDQPPLARTAPHIDADTAARLVDRPSILIPARWDRQFSALTDVVLETYLPQLHADVLVSVTPALMSAAVQLAPSEIALVHQEHRSSSDRTSGMECLLAFAPRVDLVACLTTSMADWLRAELGPVSPEISVIPNPLPVGVAPRSALDQKLIVAAGRIVLEKQFAKLIRAFGMIADEIPGWRLRILGTGPSMIDLRREVRRSQLWDRVELPGPTTNIQSEWARASISALSSRAEGLPLVVQEAMAAGVPVVSFDCPAGPRELIEHEVNGLLVPPESMAGLSRGLLRLATDGDLRHKLGAAAAESAQQYDAARIAERWEDVFHTVVSRRSGGRLAQRAQEAAAAAPPSAPRGAEEPPPRQATPGSLRTETLRLLVDVAAACGDDWFVLPPHEETPPTVVVPGDRRDEYLRRLAEQGLPTHLCLVDPGDHKWPVRRGSAGELVKELRRGQTPRVTVEPWPTTTVALFTTQVRERPTLYQNCGVNVEFWDVDVDGAWVSPQKNAYTHRVHPGSARTSTTVDSVDVPTLEHFTGPLVHRCNFPIDVVYTWVDGSDPEWNAARVRRLEDAGEHARVRSSSGRARFESRDELRYSLRSVYAFAPWVRRIYVVTAGQAPEWLDIGHPRIRLVDHREILPADALPTFNSHAIETALHRIDDLTEHFVYFNDDMFVGRPITPEQLFTPGGHPRVVFSGNPIGLVEDEAPAYLQAAANNRRILHETFGVTITRTLAHTPYAHRRSVLSEIDERFPLEVARTTRSAFRSTSDVSMLSSLAQHYGLITGAAVVGSAESEFVNLGTNDLPSRLRRLLERDNDFFCLGDFHDLGLPPDLLSSRLTEFMELYFPARAPWEVEADA